MADDGFQKFIQGVHLLGETIKASASTTGGGTNGMEKLLDVAKDLHSIATNLSDIRLCIVVMAVSVPVGIFIHCLIRLFEIRNKPTAKRGRRDSELNDEKQKGKDGSHHSEQSRGPLRPESAYEEPQLAQSSVGNRAFGRGFGRLIPPKLPLPRVPL